MAFESGMTHGYPTTTVMAAFLTALGLEAPTEDNPNYVDEFQQFVYGLASSMESLMGLSVFAPSTTTVNVRTGKYLYKGTVKTFTMGSAIDPADNDTTYVWMTPSNTISSAIDGTGWPTTEHIKLAEVDVDSDGVITAIRDMRGESLERCKGKLIEAHTSDDTLTEVESGSVHTNLGATGTVTITLPASATAGVEYIFAVQAAQELRIDPGVSAIRDDSGQTADQYKSANAIGESITIVSDSNGDWVTVAKTGTWTEEA